MTCRDEEIRQVEQGFADLADFARDAWSNLRIVERIVALQVQVQKLYPPVIVPGPPLPPPLAPPAPPPPAVDPVDTGFTDPDGFLRVTASTRWG